MLNSIVTKLKDKTVVMALLSYVLTICTTMGISVDVNNVNVVAVSICGIMTLLGIMHDSGSTTTTTTVVSELKTGEAILPEIQSKALNPTDASAGSEKVVSADN